MPINMPINPAFKASSFYLQTNTQIFESPINRATQRLELQGQRWVASFTLPKMTRSQAAEWIAFFMQLKGRTGTFYASDPDWQTNIGLWSGIPLVKGAGQTGNTLLIDGCTASQTNWARAGDYFTVNSELKRCTASKNSNGSGEVTLTFEPPLRASPADNAVISFNPATCNMILTSDDIMDWNSNHNKIFDEKTFSAYEVF